MESFVFVIVRTEWDMDLEGRCCEWEQKDVCRVCRNYEDAKAFVEKQAESESYPCKWHGDRLYSGWYIEDRMKYGIEYKLEYVMLY